MKKIIFLDIDGVLNCTNTGERLKCNAFGIDPSLVANFNTIITAHPDAKIVLSSSWRTVPSYISEFWDFPSLCEFLKASGLKGEIIDKTPEIGPRGTEILSWLQMSGYTGEYVILDDDPSKMGPHGARHVQTFFHEGLTPEKAQVAISVLNGE